MTLIVARSPGYASPRQSKSVSGFQKSGLTNSDLSEYYIRRPVPQRGGSRSSRTRSGMRWTRVALLTKALPADGEVVWS